MMFDITYSVPYEGDCQLYGLTVEEVLHWLDTTSHDNSYSADITPSDNPSYDRDEFRAKFGVK